MNHRRLRQSIVSVRYLMLLLALLAWQARPASQESNEGGGRIISFPAPPDPEGIGTRFEAIDTYVSQVTLSPPASIHRLGLIYSEIHGTIRGVGWGGSTATPLRCPYEYELPYVLRIPPDWDGGLVIFRHQFERADLALPWEEEYGDRNFYRVIHEEADRSISDVALHPSRRWAFFAVNQIGVAPGGTFNTLLLDAPNCIAGTPVSSLRDTTIARDHALLAQRLLKLLRDRDVTMTLGVGYTQGAVVHLGVNAGLRFAGAGDAAKAGDNHRTPYDPTSPHIFDGFLWIDGIPATAVADNLSALSVPTIFLFGDTTTTNQQAVINQISRFLATPGLDVPAFARAYSVRNLPIIDADMNLSLTREDIDWAVATLPSQPSAPAEYYLGSGERIRPVTGALLDGLARWATQGVPPVASLFNGQVRRDANNVPIAVDFFRTSATTQSFPYVDDTSLDTFTGGNLINTQGAATAALRTAWANVRTSLGAEVGSIVLPETACRRGRFNFVGGTPAGTDFRLFDEPTFLSRWPTIAAYQACRTQRIDALIARGVYDPTFVSVDIEPDRVSNIVDLGASERLVVAILSHDGFDATEIEPGSLRLAGASQRGVADNPGGVRTEAVDVDGDGRRDLLVHFRRDRLKFDAIDIVADVWGRTRGGVVFSGSDVIQLVN